MSRFSGDQKAILLNLQDYLLNETLIDDLLKADRSVLHNLVVGGINLTTGDVVFVAPDGSSHKVNITDIKRCVVRKAA
ncbi:MAG: hypothetical protein KBD15_03515 [Candidatus Magasanikbacteria bacterium]|jgi:hypothetical protein|nr:hypothetical protein [Candidatus Magasanikbacteria bacterium]